MYNFTLEQIEDLFNKLEDFNKKAEDILSFLERGYDLMYFRDYAGWESRIERIPGSEEIGVLFSLYDYSGICGELIYSFSIPVKYFSMVEKEIREGK